MKKFTCPYCYGTHSIYDCGLKCFYNIPGKSDKCISNVVKDSKGWVPNESKLKCLKCKSATKTIICNNVKKEIPIKFLKSKSLSIALLGAKSSGKSNYIGVLVNEIATKMSSNFNCSLIFNEESRQYYDAYYKKPLFEHGNVVYATDAAVEIPPLISELVFFNKKGKPSKNSILTLYDTAGEKLDSNKSIIENNQYIYNADGIILLLDPLQIPAIRQKLQGKITLPQQNRDASLILDSIISIIQNLRNPKGQIKTPIALVITKIDVLEKYDILKEDSCLKSESEHLKRGIFVDSDFECVNEEISAILENWVDVNIAQKLQFFEKHSLFGVSSFGGVPNGTKLENGVVKPRRVLDPLLWILAENKYIKSSKK